MRPKPTHNAGRNAARKGRPRQRRGLSHLGGRAAVVGDERVTRDLAWALDTGGDEGRSLTHGFHAYPARMHPLTAQRVLAARLGLGPASAPGHCPRGRAAPAEGGGRRPVVLDPFCGSGSVAVEALRAGTSFIGGDISPLALEIAWVRTRVWPSARCRRMAAAAGRAARLAGELARERRRTPEWVKAESGWYDPPALRDVWALRDAVDAEDDEDLRRVLRMVLSSILVKVSRQASDATTVRDRHHRFVPAGVALRLFSRRAHELAGQLHALQVDLARRGTEPVEPRFVQADARATALGEPNGAALVLTSPPYLGTYDYLFHHGRRYAVLGLPTAFARDNEIGARRRAGAGAAEAIEAYANDLTAALLRMRESLAADGRIVLLLGDGLVGDRLVRADDLIRRTAAGAGLRVAGIASQRRPNWLGGKGHAGRSEHLIELHRQA